MSDVPLKLACADFSFPLLPHDDALDLIARLGFTGVDIGLFPNRSHFQPRDYVGRVTASAKALASRVRGKGLAFADIFLQSGASLQENAENHPDAGVRAASRELFRQTLDFTKACDATHMTSLPGMHWEQESQEDSLRRAADELAWRAELARSAGVTYSVEPHMWSVAPNPATALRLVQMAPGLTLTVDYGHYTAQGIADVEIEPMLAHASHFHARAAARSLLQTTLTRNAIDYPGVVSAMKRAKYTGWVGVEYVRMGLDVVPDVDTLSETILLRDLLKKAWAATS